MLRTSAVKSIAVLLFLMAAIFSTHVKSGDYRLGVGDTVRIKVYEWPDLSGEFPVAPNGSVFLSLIGQVPAEGLTPTRLAHEISKLLETKARLEEPPSTTVEVITFRPFFVLGDVQKPGEYAYRPGLTVLQAVSLAGGIFRDETSVLQYRREAITNRGQLALLALQIDQLTARKARLEAELGERDAIEFPASLLDRKDDPQVQRLITEERLLFSSYKEQYAGQRDVLTGLKEFYEAEVETITAQISDVKEQVTKAEQELENTESLVSRGLAPRPRVFGMEQTLVGMVWNQRQLERNILRSRQNIAETQQKLLTLQGERRNRILTASQQTVEDLKAAKEQLATTRHLILDAEVMVPLALHERFGSDAPEPNYEIVRRKKSGDGPDRVDAEPETPVEPGDVIKVRRVIDPMLLQPPPVPGRAAGR